GASRDPRSGARAHRANAPHDDPDRRPHPGGVARGRRGGGDPPDGHAGERSERELRGEGARRRRRLGGVRAFDRRARGGLHAPVVRGDGAGRPLMLLYGALMTQAAAFGLILSRLAGFVVASPFPGNHVGATQRVGLVVVLAWVTSLFAPTSAAPP